MWARFGLLPPNPRPLVERSDATRNGAQKPLEECVCTLVHHAHLQRGRHGVRIQAVCIFVSSCSKFRIFLTIARNRLEIMLFLKFDNEKQQLLIHRARGDY